MDLLMVIAVIGFAVAIGLVAVRLDGSRRRHHSSDRGDAGVVYAGDGGSGNCGESGGGCDGGGGDGGGGGGGD